MYEALWYIFVLFSVDIEIYISWRFSTLETFLSLFIVV